MFPFLKNPALSHFRTTYYESLTALTLLENIPGRLEQLLAPVVNRVDRLCALTAYNDADCV